MIVILLFLILFGENIASTDENFYSIHHTNGITTHYQIGKESDIKAPIYHYLLNNTSV